MFRSPHDAAQHSRQLSALRDLRSARFDFLAGVLFAEDYSVMRAAIIPYAVALRACVIRGADEQS